MGMVSTGDTNRRRGTYVWASWITGLLSGDEQCAFKVWLRANYKVDKVPSSFDLKQWSAQHAEMVREVADRLRADDWAVSVEDQNKFHITVGQVRLGCKPDIVAVRGTEAVVVDCKTGQPRDSDVWQGVLYMRGAVLALGLDGYRVSGRLEYRNDTEDAVDIPPERVSEESRGLIARIITAAGAVDPPLQVPSPSECSRCDILPADCPSRMAPVEREPVQANEF